MSVNLISSGSGTGNVGGSTESKNGGLYNGISLGGSYYSSGSGSGYSSRYSSGSQSRENTNLNSYRVINQASQSLLVPNRSLDSIFLRFPSCG